MSTQKRSTYGQFFFGPQEALATILATFLPGWKVSTFFDGTVNWVFVRGLRALRGARCLISKMPKFRSSKRPVFNKTSKTLSRNRWTTSLAVIWSVWLWTAISRMISFFVKINLLDGADSSALLDAQRRHCEKEKRLRDAPSNYTTTQSD
jgi:hypothetical protein